MDAIAKEHPAARFWGELMRELAAALAARGAHPARTVVLLPYAQLMPVARSFWAAAVPDGFAPRFETTMNWARQFPFVPAASDIAFDRGRDLLVARDWLEQGGLRAQADALAGRLVDAAWQAADAARAIPPQGRERWAAALREPLLAGMDSPLLAAEAALARIALAWAAASAYATDALFSERAGETLDALIVLEGPQSEPVVRSLVERWAGRAHAWPLNVDAPPTIAAWHAATDGADEAERAAACVLQHLAADRRPVALAATDRVLTRRVRALLGQRGVALRDETGWKLSTTRVAATVVGGLRACAWDASSDAVLDWLKNMPACTPGIVQGLERRVRRAGQREWRRLRPGDWGESPALRGAVEQVEAWRAAMAAPRGLVAWLESLRGLLEAGGAWQPLSTDAAGLQILAALRLGAPGASELSALPRAARRMDLREFTAWVSEVLESLPFMPPRPQEADVLVLPLAQLLGLPAGAVVLPGCDERSLPAAPELPDGWSEAQRQVLGLPGRATLEQLQRAAWQQALAAPHCDVLWRSSDDTGETLLPSPLVQALLLEGRARRGEEPREPRALRPETVARPLPQAAALAPQRLSASGYEDLRRCPYRFFAFRMLGLKDAQEIDTEVDKRDFGTWLHGVLKAFHEEMRVRGGVPDPQARKALLDEAARAGIESLRLGEGEFLPFAAGWPALRDGYLDWLARHEAAGHVFREAEGEHRRTLGALELEGRIDRIDAGPGGVLRVFDYKTEGLLATEERMKAPLEDTQLAFYAVLLGDEPHTAAYLNVGERGKVKEVAHPFIDQAAHLLKEAIAADLRHVASGAPLPALGEGRTCDFCAARGLCRKDGWT